MIIITDSGSTKTAWCLVNGQNIKLINTQGINPFHLDEHQIINIINQELCHQIEIFGAENGFKDVFQEIHSVFFYGAGCTEEKAPVVTTAIRKTLCNDARIIVKSDMEGAAKGLCADQPGIVCILGTGSNSCYYDGQNIVDNIPPLGYVLGDEGSGAYIGKRLVGNCLKKQFSEEICQLFLNETKLTAQSIVQKVYRENMPSRFLADLSTFCARHRNLTEINLFIIDCFKEFFIRNVNLYNCPEIPVSFVGSIAWFYKEELKEAARITGFKIGKIMQSPITGLIDYHVGKSNLRNNDC